MLWGVKRGRPRGEASGLDAALAGGSPYLAYYITYVLTCEVVASVSPGRGRGREWRARMRA